MKDKIIYRKLLIVLLLPIGILLSYITSFYPHIIEKIYSNGVYKLIGQLLSITTGLVPFSFSELIIVLIVLYTIKILITTIIKLINNKKNMLQIVFHLFLNLSIFVSIAYFLFILMWGLNYNRLPFYEIANLNIRPVTNKELEILCERLIKETNSLRNKVHEDSKGIMRISDSYSIIFRKAYDGYEAVSGKYPELKGTYGNPKKVVLSNIMSYLGISGIYFPFTGEANINTSIPDCLLPATICHEMAHQRGIAREEEANYIAYLTCRQNPDVQFQYSGMLLALIHSMKALNESNKDKYVLLKKKYNPGVARDLDYIKEYWKKYESPIERLHSKINDIYLKSNRQKHGIKSYDRMVELLIAESLFLTN